MPPRDQLYSINLLRTLDDDMLDRLSPLISASEVRENAVIFEEGDRADRLFMLRKGKVLLNMTASESVRVTVMSVEPGVCFGWTAVLGGGYYSAEAVAVEPSVIWEVSARDFLVLLHNDHTMGFRVMDFVAREINIRLTKRTNQLFKALLEHLDMVCGIKTV